MLGILKIPSRTQICTASKLLFVQGYYEALEAPRIYTHKQASTTFKRLVRKKKRSYLSKLEAHVYRLFLGQEGKRAWKMFNEMQPTYHKKLSYLRLFTNMHRYYMISPSSPTPQAHGPLIWTYIYGIHCVVWLRASSHCLEINVSKYAWIPLEERICRMCHRGVEPKEHVCH